MGIFFENLEVKRDSRVQCRASGAYHLYDKYACLKNIFIIL
jgi:hypothetical protein